MVVYHYMSAPWWHLVQSVPDRSLKRRAQVRLTNIVQVTQGWILKGFSSVLCSDDQDLLSYQGHQKTLLPSRRNLCPDVSCNSVHPSPLRLSNLTVSVVISETNINQTFLQAELKRHVFYFLLLHLRIQMMLPSFQPVFWYPTWQKYLFSLFVTDPELVCPHISEVAARTVCIAGGFFLHFFSCRGQYHDRDNTNYCLIL